jgi:hypothetical protein
LELEPSHRMEILERACVKMKTSGHKEEFIREAVEKGIRAFTEKVERSRLDSDHPGYQPLYQKAGWKRNEKSKEKALKRGNWYKGGEGVDELRGVDKRVKRGRVMKPFQKAGRKQKNKSATTVIFVPSTKGSVLLKSLKDDEDRMAEITGFKVRYQEAGGSALTNSFNKNLGQGQHCGRSGCPPCDGSEEKRGNCRAKNIVYESKCVLCNPVSIQQEGTDDNQPSGRNTTTIATSPREGIYIGESSRSLHERAVEHVRDAGSFSVKSHIIKHWMTSHPDIPSPPKMMFSVTARYRDCLSRQVGEALKIHYSNDIILNSKSEYMSNKLSRLTIEEDAWERRERARQEEEEERMAKEMVDEFKKSKSTPPSGASLPGGSRLDTTPAVPAQGGGPWEKQENTAKRNMVAAHQAPVEYETDEDEFADDRDDHQLMRNEPSIVCVPIITYETDEDEFEGEDPGPTSNPPFVRSVTLGQSKRSPGDTLLNSAECPQVRHEHPWMRTEQRVDGEHGDGVLMRKKATAKRKDTKEYSLAYFNLWWRRMEREAAKVIVMEEGETLRNTQERSLRSMLTNRKTDGVGRATLAPPFPSNPDGRDVELLGPESSNTLVGTDRVFSGVVWPGISGRDRVLSADIAIYEWTQENNIINGQHHTLPDRAPESKPNNDWSSRGVTRGREESEKD